MYSSKNINQERYWLMIHDWGGRDEQESLIMVQIIQPFFSGRLDSNWPAAPQLPPWQLIGRRFSGPGPSSHANKVEHRITLPDVSGTCAPQLAIKINSLNIMAGLGYGS